MRKVKTRVSVIGSGIGGLTAAIDLARAGCDVDVFERGPKPGGKIRQLEVNGIAMDAGPTVFTMRWVFEELFKDAGSKLSEELTSPVIKMGSLSIHRNQLSRLVFG